MSIHSQNLDFTNEALFRNVEEALNDYHNLRCDESPFAHLLLFKIAAHGSNRSPRGITNHVLTEALDMLEKSSPQDVLFIQRRFFDRESMVALGRRMHISEGHIYTLRKRAIEALTTVLYAQEEACRNEQYTQWEGRLSTATYYELFGIEEHMETLLPLVLSADTPDLIVLEGIGGIGKTSLADALMRQLISQYLFDDFAWVSLKTKQLTPQGMVTTLGAPNSDTRSIADEVVHSLLQQLAPDIPQTPNMTLEQSLQILEEGLNSARTFVVIDNLEVLAEAEMILPLLERLMNPSRFLITSRIRIPSIHTTYPYAVPPLSLDDGLRLIRQESSRGNISHLAQNDDATLGRMYDAVGGNPLALRLVVGLAHTQALPDILEGLKKAPTAKTEELYRYIYLQVWQALGELATAVLVYMPIASAQGDPLAYIVDGVGLPKAAVQTGLDQLVDLNLVNVHRDTTSYRYSIHNLTRTFLLNDAIEWGRD